MNALLFYLITIYICLAGWLLSLDLVGGMIVSIIIALVAIPIYLFIKCFVKEYKKSKKFNQR